MAPSLSLKHKIKQKLLKPKYTPQIDEDPTALCSSAIIQSHADIELDALSDKTSSRCPSAEPSPETHAYHDITASLLSGDAASAGKSDQGHLKTAPRVSSASFKGCMPFSKPKSTLLTTSPHDLPKAVSSRETILSKLGKAVKKTEKLTPPPAAKPVPKPPTTKARVKVCQYPLHMAAWRTNAAELLEQLAKPGADANKRDKNSTTPLHYAAWQGSIDCVQVLLEHNAEVNKADAEGMLPIHFAAMFNRLDVAAMLLDRGSLLQQPPAKKSRLQVPWPTTPLVVAAKMGHKDMVTLLMERGANMSGVAKGSKCALHEATLCGHAVVVEQMLQLGADHSLALPKTGYCALHLAALKGFQPVVQVLLLAGADVDARAKDGRTPLHLACEHGHLKAATALLGLGGASLSARDNSGLTPLHIAVDKNHLLLAKTLMDHGAVVETNTKMGALPLNFAHDPDFYKLLRAVRWYSASSCPSGNNPSSSSYWSPPGAMQAAAANAAAAAAAADPLAVAVDTSAAAVDTPAAAVDICSVTLESHATLEPAGQRSEGNNSRRRSRSNSRAASATPDDDVARQDTPARFQAPSPTQVLGESPSPPAAVKRAEPTPLSAAYGANGMFVKSGKKLQASNWLKSLQQLTGRNMSSAAQQKRLLAKAAGGFNRLPTRPGLPLSNPVHEVPCTDDAGLNMQHHSRSSSRASSVSLAPSKRSPSARHSPCASEGSSVVARTAAAEVARAAVAAVIEQATREEQEANRVAAAQHEVAAAAAAADVQAPTRGARGGSPEARSQAYVLPERPASAAAAPATRAMTTTAELRRLLGFDDHVPDNTSSKVLPGDVARRDVGDQDKWLPGTAATPTSVATFAAFAADAAQQDDIKAAAARVAAGANPGASVASPGQNVPVPASKMSVTAAAAAFTASAAAAAAAAFNGMQGGVDAVKQSSPGGSATKGSAGKKAKSNKVLPPWRA